MMGKGKFHYAYSMVFSCFILQMVMVVGLQSVPLMLGDIAETLQISATEAGGLTGPSRCSTAASGSCGASFPTRSGCARC